MDGPVHQKTERNMSAYGAAPSAPMLPQQSPSLSNNYIPYPPLPNLPPNASNSIYPDVDPQLAPPTQAQTPSNNNTSKNQGHSGEARARLRKACDSCSVRKVKCDEQQPCKACEGLQIPCTFERPSKRRGPPNKHAESLKRKYDSPDDPAMAQPQSSSPTHAAHTLAYFAQQQVLSAETICPLPMLQRLVDDYFTFIHPLVPLPHEQSFRDAFGRRQDQTNPTFVALIASMLGYLVACFPRRPRQHIEDCCSEPEQRQQMVASYTNSMELVDRCHKIAMEALGPTYLDHKMSVHDAVVNYLQALTCVQTFNRQSAIHYFKQCMTISATVGLHKVNVTNNANTNGHSLPAARMTANGHPLEGPHHVGVDQLMRELGGRTFWALFTGVKSFQQAGVSQWDLLIPPATPSHPYPPLPVEVEDSYITPDRVHVEFQPPGLIPAITGFNANVRLLSTYNDLAALELVRGVDEVVDWERQKRVMEESLQSVKRVLDGLPSELVLSFQAPSPQSREPKYPSPNPESSVAQEIAQYATNGFDNTRIDFNRPEERRRIQYEIQKANIYVTQLATHLYLVDKYWNLYDAYKVTKLSGGNSDRALSPGVIAPILDKYDPSNHLDSPEQDLAMEREDIVKKFLIFLGEISEINAEPLGNSFISEINRIARVLLDAPLARKGTLAQRSETYLRASLAVLEKLDMLSPTGNWQSDVGEVPNLWATLRDYQAKFAQSGGYGTDV